MARVAGKVALVTGAARGLGAADARMLAQEGARVVLSDVIDGEPVAKAVDGLFLSHDVSKPEDWTRVLDTVRERFGRLDILVNNAGVLLPGNPETAELDDLHRMFAVAVDGTFLGVKHAMPLLKESGAASIINISSITAMRYFPETVGYAAAKGAIRSFTKAVAGHCKAQGLAIRCNSVHPSGIDTPMVRGLRDLPADEAPAPGLGAAEDVAAMVVYLASDESRFVNGAEFVIDDGYCAA